MSADWTELLLLRTWWSYDPADGSLHSIAYHWFNVLEGVAWLACGGGVLARFLRYRKSSVEVAYCIAFLTFAASDFREAWSLESWLIWAKALNLAALLWLRRTVRRRHYPTNRLL